MLESSSVSFFLFLLKLNSSSTDQGHREGSSSKDGSTFFPFLTCETKILVKTIKWNLFFLCCGQLIHFLSSAVKISGPRESQSKLSGLGEGEENVYWLFNTFTLFDQFKEHITFKVLEGSEYSSVIFFFLCYPSHLILLLFCSGC